MAFNASGQTEVIIREAIENPRRYAEEVAHDAARKPAEVLSFFGIAPGMTVLDVLAGAGYYTELLSYIVGPEGEVTYYNNEVWANGLESLPEAPWKGRLKDGRLPNVRTLVAPLNDFEPAPDHYDAILFILGFHDLYYANEEIGWAKVDVDRFLATLHRSLKSGGILGIVDHAAPAGAPETSGGTLHRIDPALVVERLTAAGFVLDGESEALRNPDDDRSQSMNDVPRWTTDRVVYRFRKP